jgi:inorganic pyrophosphatase
VDVDVIVEIPTGSRTSTSSTSSGAGSGLDRMLFTSTGYPTDYGFVPDTLAEDGDPIDVLVPLTEPTFPGWLVSARVIAVFWTRDKNGPDAKLLCVPATDPRHAHLQDLGEVPMHQISEIWHFFQIYQALEPGKSSASRNWERRKEATQALEDAGAGSSCSFPRPPARPGKPGARRHTLKRNVPGVFGQLQLTTN